MITKEQIEELGWNYTIGEYEFGDSDYYLLYPGDEGYYYIAEGVKDRFAGKLQNKQELETIMRQIGIL